METKKVLFVDDEENILKSIKRLLFGEPYELITTTNPKEALLILEHADVHVIVSDQSMPELSGIQFLQRVKDMHPETIRVILSGHVDVDLIVEAVNKGEVYRYITKPWKDDELIVTVRQCLDHYDILQQNKSLSEKVRFQNDELKRMNEKLADEVHERTRYLQLSQEILENMPIPVIGVDKSYKLILVNQMARESFHEFAASLPGTPLKDLLPADLYQALVDCFESDSSDSLKAALFCLKGKIIEPLMNILGQQDEKRGFVLALNIIEE